MSRELIVRTINQMHNIVFWQTNDNFTKQIYLSESFENVWGRKCQWMFSNSSNWYSSIHNEDITNVIANTKQRLLKKSDFNLILYRIILPNNKIHYIKDICCRAPNNTFVGFSEQLSYNTWDDLKQHNTLSIEQAKLNIAVVVLLKLLFANKHFTDNVFTNKTTNNNKIVYLNRKN